jgi:hypothetical protein
MLGLKSFRTVAVVIGGIELVSRKNQEGSVQNRQARRMEGKAAGDLPTITRETDPICPASREGIITRAR